MKLFFDPDDSWHFFRVFRRTDTLEMGQGQRVMDISSSS